jgi:hypothetical protein
MNAGLSEPTTQLTFSTNWDVQSCHWECQENSSRNFASTAVDVDYPDCLGFSITDPGGDCKLYYNGVCTKDASATANTKYYAITGFIEKPFVTADTCTHLKVLEQDAKLVAACKEHTSDSTGAACKAESYVSSSGGDCYYEIHDRATCASGGGVTTLTASQTLQ